MARFDSITGKFVGLFATGENLPFMIWDPVKKRTVTVGPVPREFIVWRDTTLSDSELSLDPNNLLKGHGSDVD